MKSSPFQKLATVIHPDRQTVIRDHLKKYIVGNRLQPGDRLPTEEQMAEQLGVSRTALREALRGMEALDIIAVQQGVGRVVLPFSFQPLLEKLSYGFIFHNTTILQIMEIRQSLDAFFIEAAIHHLEEEDLGKLSKLVDEMQSRTMAGLDMDETDYDFHKLLYERCGNPLALQLFEVAWRVRMAALDMATATREIPSGSAEDHQELLQAMRVKDVVLARQLIVSHHRHVLRRFGQEVELELANSASRTAETSAMEGGDRRWNTEPVD